MGAKNQNVLEPVSGTTAVKLFLKCIFIGLWQLVQFAVRRLWKGHRRKFSKNFPPVELTVDSSIGIHCYIKIMGVKYHYVETGPKNGQLVLILGDAPDAGNLWVPSWAAVVRRLAETRHHVVTLDLRGTGGSECGSRRDLSPPRVVEELSALFRKNGLELCKEKLIDCVKVIDAMRENQMIKHVLKRILPRIKSHKVTARMIMEQYAQAQRVGTWRTAAARWCGASWWRARPTPTSIGNTRPRLSVTTRFTSYRYLAHCRGALVRRFVVAGAPHPNLYWQHPPAPFCHHALYFIQWPHFPERWLAERALAEGEVSGLRARDWTGALNYVRGGAWWRIVGGHRAEAPALLVGARAAAAQLVASAQHCARPALRLLAAPHPADPDLPALLLDFLAVQKVEEAVGVGARGRGLVGRVLGAVAGRGRDLTARLALPALSAQA
ncbi:hypothetical protein RR48_08196 [Papilio machaon]|uniref:Epoxide hydrolase 4 n=1 Tax=Papilio machaon TaxID=76193 RepID=A0A194RJR6_PAPMA|nr:hypothetical protein RR48_08196 [Papilio machaon]